MLQALIGPVAELAGGWLKGKASAQAASANLKLVEAEAKATIMKSAATSEADWEKIMAQGTQNSWKDEYLVLSVFYSINTQHSCHLSGLNRRLQMVLLRWTQCRTGTAIHWE